MPITTSPQGASLTFEGTLLQIGNGMSPESWTTITNVDSYDQPVIAKTIEDTNVGDHWVRRRPTLNDMGKIMMGVFWQPKDTTQGNVAGGLRYLLINQLLTDFQTVYPTSPTCADSYPAYVTSFSISSKVGDVFKAKVELSNDGEPTLI